MMIKPLLTAAAITLLCACSAPKSTPPTPGEAPRGVVKLMGGDNIITWLDLRTVSSWQGNPQLRRVYMINNYIKPSLIKENPDLYISSSRAINVINCERSERAVFERVYFTEPFAEGKVVSIRQEIGQWEAFPKDSLAGMFARLICKIEPERLKPQPPKETRQPILD